MNKSKDELKKISNNLLCVNNQIEQLLESLNDKSKKHIKFNNYSADGINIIWENQQAILTLSNLDFIQSENLIGKSGSIIVDDFIFENSFITSYDGALFTLMTNNLIYKNNANSSFNIVIWDKPQKLNRLCSYISDSSFVSLSFEINEIEFTIINKHEKLFLLTGSDLDEKSFLEYSRCIKLALGFLMCDFIGGKMLLVSADKNYLNLNTFKILHTTSEQVLNFDVMLDGIPILEDQCQVRQDCPTVLSKEQFVKLCTLILENPRLETSLHYIAQSNALWLEHKLTILAVALEAMTGFVGTKYTNNKKNVTETNISMNTLLPTKEYSSFYNDFEKFLEYYTFDDNVKKTLKGKIHNSISNKDSLSKPFEVFGIKLSEDERSLLGKRNDLLHGKKFEYNNLNCYQDFMNQVYTYYYFLYILLLKVVGYKGVIWDIRQTERIISINNNSVNNSISNSVDVKDYLIYL